MVVVVPLYMYFGLQIRFLINFRFSNLIKIEEDLIRFTDLFVVVDLFSVLFYCVLMFSKLMVSDWCWTIKRSRILVDTTTVSNFQEDFIRLDGSSTYFSVLYIYIYIYFILFRKLYTFIFVDSSGSFWIEVCLIKEKNKRWW